MKAGWLQTRMISKGRAGEKRESEHVPASRKSLGTGAEQEWVQCSPGSQGTRCLPPGRTTAARLARAGSSDWHHGMSPIHDHGVRHQTGLGIIVHHPREARLVDAQCYYGPREHPPFFFFLKKKGQFREMEMRMLIARSWEKQERRWRTWRLHISRYKKSKLWGSNAEHGGYDYNMDIVYLSCWE